MDLLGRIQNEYKTRASLTI